MRPTSRVPSPSVAGDWSTGPIRLAIVISKPSSTQVTPSAITSLVWKRDQGRRSMRAGTRLLTTGPGARVDDRRASGSCPGTRSRCPGALSMVDTPDGVRSGRVTVHARREDLEEDPQLAGL